MFGGAVDKGGNTHLLAGSMNVFTIKEGAGPVLDKFIIRNLRVPVTLAAVESYTAAGRKLITSYSLVAAYDAAFEVFYCGRYA